MVAACVVMGYLGGVLIATILPGFSGTLLEFHYELPTCSNPLTGPGSTNQPWTIRVSFDWKFKTFAWNRSTRRRKCRNFARKFSMNVDEQLENESPSFDYIGEFWLKPAVRVWWWKVVLICCFLTAETERISPNALTQSVNNVDWERVRGVQRKVMQFCAVFFLLHA